VDMPFIDAASLARLPDGRFSFGLTAQGAAQATVQGSTNLQFWQDLQIVPLTNGSAVFTDNSASNFPNRFYKLHVP